MPISPKVQREVRTKGSFLKNARRAVHCQLFLPHSPFSSLFMHTWSTVCVIFIFWWAQPIWTLIGPFQRVWQTCTWLSHSAAGSGMCKFEAEVKTFFFAAAWNMTFPQSCHIRSYWQHSFNLLSSLCHLCCHPSSRMFSILSLALSYFYPQPVYCKPSTFSSTDIKCN